MTPNKHTLHAAFHMEDLYMDVFLYSSEKQPEYEIHYKKECLFQGKVNFPLVKDGSAISISGLIELLTYITTLPSQTAHYNDRQIAWILSLDYQTLCRYLAQYRRNSKIRVAYFQQAFIYYVPASTTNLYDIVNGLRVHRPELNRWEMEPSIKVRAEGNGWRESSRWATVLTDDQQNALLRILAAGAAPDIQERIKKAMKDHFKKCYPSELMKKLWITENDAGYNTERNSEAELEIIRSLIVHPY